MEKAGFARLFWLLKFRNMMKAKSNLSSCEGVISPKAPKIHAISMGKRHFVADRKKREVGKLTA